MTDEAQPDKQSQLVRLIRRIAKEEAWQILDEHLSDYVHQKPAEETELQ
jgi:hypothetical protein